MKSIKYNPLPILIVLIVSLLFCGCNRTDSGPQGSIGGPTAADSTRQLSDEYLDRLLNTQLDFVKSMIGKKASKIRLNTVNDQPFDLESFKGKTVVMNFWYIGCGSCMKEIPDLNKVYADSKNEDFEFVSVASNSKEELRTFFARQDSEEAKYARMEYDVIPGEKTVADAYDVKFYPVTLIINSEGIIKYGVPYVYMPTSTVTNPTYLLIKRAIRKTENLTG